MHKCSENNAILAVTGSAWAKGWCTTCMHVVPCHVYDYLSAKRMHIYKILGSWNFVCANVMFIYVSTTQKWKYEATTLGKKIDTIETYKRWWQLTDDLSTCMCFLNWEGRLCWELDTKNPSYVPRTNPQEAAWREPWILFSSGAKRTGGTAREEPKHNQAKEGKSCI